MQVCLPVTQGTALHVFRIAWYCHYFTHIAHTYIVSSEAARSPQSANACCTVHSIALAWTPARACAFQGHICASSDSDVPQLHCMTHKIGGQGLGWVERARLHKKNWVERPDYKLSSQADDPSGGLKSFKRTSYVSCKVSDHSDGAKQR